jgi:hypothetical protein
MKMLFEWDKLKNIQNTKKHKVRFDDAQLAFFDSKRVLAQDIKHSKGEKRYYCFGLVKGGVITIRFTYRKN